MPLQPHARAWRGPILVVLSLCVACVPKTDYLVSVPEAPNAGGRVRERGLEIPLPELKVWLEALDVMKREWVDVADGAFAAPPSLMLLVSFTAGNSSYSFDPMQVIVRTSDGRRLTPTGYVGPGRYSKGDPGAADWVGIPPVPRGCSMFPESAGQPADSRHAIVRDCCFVMEYPVAVTDRFDVELIGLAIGSARVSLPPIGFRRAMVSTNVYTLRPAIPKRP